MISQLVKRYSTLLRKGSSSLRSVLPNNIIRLLKKGESKAVTTLRTLNTVRHKSHYDNIYHIALQKTGTQWMEDILSDPILSDPVVYIYSGMTVEEFDVPRRKSQAHPLRSLQNHYPINTIITGFPKTYENYLNDFPKANRDDALFHVIRDPREMVVSWYLSTKDNHLVDYGSMMSVNRCKLRKMDKKEGLRYVIELFDWKGKFQVMRSWMNLEDNENVKVVKFEDLTENSLDTFSELFDFLDVNIPGYELESLLESYGFETLTGRKKGNETTSSHVRTGKSGSWKYHFDSDLVSLFEEKASDIVDGYGYR